MLWPVEEVRLNKPVLILLCSLNVAFRLQIGSTLIYINLRERNVALAAQVIKSTVGLEFFRTLEAFFICVSSSESLLP